jgi:hypothetical protein
MINPFSSSTALKSLWPTEKRAAEAGAISSLLSFRSLTSEVKTISLPSLLPTPVLREELGDTNKGLHLIPLSSPPIPKSL